MREVEIHPTALVSPKAALGEGVKVGPYSIIDERTEIGDGCEIDSSVRIYAGVRMGKDNVIFHGSLLGGPPQDFKFDVSRRTELVIGDSNVIREGGVAHRSTTEETPTSIGSGCLLMSTTHIGHDCRIGNGCVLSSLAALGGAVEVGDFANLGGGVTVHQFCRVGAYSLVGGGTKISKDMIPFSIALLSDRTYVSGLNLIGLRRNGLSAGEIASVSKIYRALKKGTRVDDIEYERNRFTDYFINWLKVPTRRGLHRFPSRRGKPAGALS